MSYFGGMDKPSLHLVAGPTASGKTAAALELARKQPSVVINADAMQIYRGLPILTAQPTAKEKEDVRHVLFEIFAEREKGSVGIWLAKAEKELEAALAQNVTPIVVGGTGLYFHALLHGLAEIPPIPEEVHATVAHLYEMRGHDAFRAALAKVDSDSAEKIMPNDRQRLIRAYEVAAHTGRTLSAWQKQTAEENEKKERPIDRFAPRTHILMPPRAALYTRCDARFITMVKAGALNEVRALMAQNLAPDLPAMKVLGVRELAAHLSGKISLDDAISQAQQATRNYAKRQVTWFKNQKIGE